MAINAMTSDEARRLCASFGWIACAGSECGRCEKIAAFEAQVRAEERERCAGIARRVRARWATFHSVAPAACEEVAKAIEANE